MCKTTGGNYLNQLKTNPDLCGFLDFGDLETWRNKKVYVHGHFWLKFGAFFKINNQF